MAATEQVTQKLGDLKVSDPTLASSTTTTTTTSSDSKLVSSSQDGELNQSSSSTNTSNNDTSSGDIIPSATVLKSTENFSVIHPFSSSWTLWYIKPPTAKKEDWSELLTEVVTFSSVEEFWGAYNNLPKVSELPLRSDYALFKTGIRPEWEDKQNANGGKVVYGTKDSGPSPAAVQAAAQAAAQVSKLGSAAAAAAQAAANAPVSRIDEIWLNLLLGLVGGTLDLTNDPSVSVEDQKINGVFVNVRKAAVRFNLWTKDLDVENIKSIALRFKDLLKIDPNDELEFSPLDTNSGRSKKRTL